MTENEAIKVFNKPTKHIKKFMLDGEETICYSTDMVKAFETAIKALTDIQAYRAIGTVEEFKALKEAPMTEDELKEFEMLSDIVEQLQKLEEYKHIGTSEEWCIAVDRMKSKKPNYVPLDDSCLYYENYCPNCEALLIVRYKNCPNCGQKLDWSD